MIEAERSLLAAKGFSANLVHFLPPYHVIICNVHHCSVTGTISHVHGLAPKTILRARNLVFEKLWFMKACIIYDIGRMQTINRISSYE